MSVLTSKSRLGDLLKFEVSPLYSRESGVLRNTSGETITVDSLLGTPVKKVSGKWVPVLAADIANATGLVLHQSGCDALANNTDYGLVNVLVRGAAIDGSALPTDDVTGDAIDMAVFKSTLQALNVPIVCLTQISPTETQTS